MKFIPYVQSISIDHNQSNESTAHPTPSQRDGAVQETSLLLSFEPSSSSPGEKVQKICRTFVEDSQMCSVFALVFASVFGLCWYQAFAPVVAGTDGRQIAIAWRDDQRKGNCRRGVEESRCRAAVAAIAYGEYRLSPFTRLRAAVLGTSGVRGAEMVRSSES